MWHFIIPLSLIFLAGAVGCILKKRKEKTFDPTEDFYHDHDHEDIWRKSA